MNAKTTFMLEPKAPLVFRSAKPFGAGSRDGANFPWPSSWAGLLRTRAMLAKGWSPKLDDKQKQELLSLATAGPFLARQDDDGTLTVFLPRPADAVRLQGADSDSVKRLAPTNLNANVGTDLPQGLLPLSFVDGKPKGKPKASAAQWSLHRWTEWALKGTTDAEDSEDESDWQQIESRTHVAISVHTQAAADGQLFQTDGWDFSPRRNESVSGSSYAKHHWVFVGLGPVSEDEHGSGLVTFGGERRLSWLSILKDNPLSCPDELRTALKGCRRFAVTFATPALFSGGWIPGWLDDQLQGNVPGHPEVRVQLKAAHVERWLPVSGWDLHAGGPKATRRAVAPGATYWFEVLDGQVLDADALWLQSICDSQQDARDGFALVLPRPWL